jgi:dTDP-4-dehydrorhamnose 3,5-epimerase
MRQNYEVHETKNIQSFDSRGSFRKTFYEDLNLLGGSFEVREVFMTNSRKGTIRGLHFQLPPKSQSKLISVLQGSIHEVFVDIRLGSPEYGVIQSKQISARSDKSNTNSLLIPSGFAHGYQALEEETIVQYITDFPFDPSLDSGININSFEICFPLELQILSERDQNLPLIENFSNPFLFETD